ncbi:hypothetical protein HHK36_005981 [Tetracentron sinense]|uniref:DUF4220 domain-containing protein n=1 Tax=Tetracentron sinense TaxID=13715 RepID=A0A834ZJJ8_TETSI|nr:hypothetical protein HHK36_005981 [Tetracentron sinense]
MLITIVSSLIFVEKKRRAMEIDPKGMRKLWKEWELQTMVVISLFLQIVLILFGNRRKRTARNWVRIILWLAYLLADWVATVSLGILSNNQGDSDGGRDHSPDQTDILTAFWAPFLLLHLGGPDTITAYSLEDNELWLRHLLALIFQFCVAFYVFLSSWTGAPILILSIPMFVAGMIKYGERTWVLRSASRQHFRDSMLTPPDPGPNYAKFIEEHTTKDDEGYIVTVNKVKDAPHVVGHNHTISIDGKIPDTGILLEAHYYYETFKRLFADLILSFQETQNSQSYFLERNCEEAFKVVEVELGFMYDALYTKSTVVNTVTGYILRLISLSSTVSAFVAFLIIKKDGFKNIDIIITHLLLVGAIALEIYAAILVLISEQTFLHLSNHKSRLAKHIFESFRIKKMWSNSMAQYNLFSFCLDEKPTKFAQLQKLFCIYEVLEQYRYKTLENVSPELKELIFRQLKEKAERGEDVVVRKQLCTRRDALIQENECFREFIETEFDQIILLWHIATDLCFHSDSSETQSSPNCKISKLVSEYMLYLLVMCPFMLPNGIGQIRFRDTCAEFMNFFIERKSIKDRKTVEIKILPSEVKGDRSKSVLFDASRLAKLLESLKERKWETMSEVWVELLSYAASQCRGFYHAQQLRRGGELLTHVWLLMAHLGLTEQIQISKGHVRAKLSVR